MRDVFDVGERGDRGDRGVSPIDDARERGVCGLKLKRITNVSKSPSRTKTKSIFR